MTRQPAIILVFAFVPFFKTTTVLYLLYLTRFDYLDIFSVFTLCLCHWLDGQAFLHICQSYQTFNSYSSLLFLLNYDLNDCHVVRTIHYHTRSKNLASFHPSYFPGFTPFIALWTTLQPHKYSAFQNSASLTIVVIQGSQNLASLRPLLLSRFVTKSQPPPNRNSVSIPPIVHVITMNIVPQFHHLIRRLRDHLPQRIILHTPFLSQHYALRHP